MITVIVPTRGRPHSIGPLVEAWLDTRTLKSTHLHVVVDGEEGETLEAYAEARDAMWEPWWSIDYAPRRRLAGTLNAVAPRISGHVGFMGDDHRPRTKGWDERIAETLAETPLGVVYGDDRIQGQRLPTAVVLHADIVPTLGFMVPPGMVHLYVDDYWKLLGERLGTLRYLPDVVIEHLHPTAGTAPSDAGYAEVNHWERYAADHARFREFVDGGEMDAAIAALEAL